MSFHIRESRNPSFTSGQESRHPSNRNSPFTSNPDPSQQSNVPMGIGRVFTAPLTPRQPVSSAQFGPIHSGNVTSTHLQSSDAITAPGTVSWGRIGNPVVRPTQAAARNGSSSLSGNSLLMSPGPDLSVPLDVDDLPDLPSPYGVRQHAQPYSTPSEFGDHERVRSQERTRSSAASDIDSLQGPLPSSILSNINSLCHAYGLTDTQNVDLQGVAKLANAERSNRETTLEIMQHAALLKLLSVTSQALEKIEGLETRLVSLERASEQAWKPSKHQLEVITTIAQDLIMNADRLSYCALDNELPHILEKNKEKYELKEVYASVPKTMLIQKAAREKASRTRAQFRRHLLHGIARDGSHHATLGTWAFNMFTKYKTGGVGFDGKKVEFRYVIRAALLRNFATANEGLLRTEDSDDRDCELEEEGGSTAAVEDPDADPGPSIGSGKRKNGRGGTGHPPAKKQRGGQGKQVGGTHFFAKLDLWLGELYGKFGLDLNAPQWKQFINDIIAQDFRDHGSAAHWAFPELVPAPTTPVDAPYEAPRGYYGNMRV